MHTTFDEFEAAGTGFLNQGICSGGDGTSRSDVEGKVGGAFINCPL